VKVLGWSDAPEPDAPVTGLQFMGIAGAGFGAAIGRYLLTKLFPSDEGDSGGREDAGADLGTIGDPSPGLLRGHCPLDQRVNQQLLPDLRPPKR
jgi:hypothetical protein